MTWALIEAEEGEFGEIFSAPTSSELRVVIQRYYDDKVARSTFSSDPEYWKEHAAALLQMLDGAPTTAGWHKLDPIEPHWHPWVLIVPANQLPEPGVGSLDRSWNECF